MKSSAVLGLAAAAILGLGAAPGLAQTRVFVSGSGSDANPCSLSAPCRSFQQAHNMVLAGGEIVALTAAGYGPLTIAKAVTISASGIEASITSNGGNPAITIGAGASDEVAIRGLTLFSGAPSGDGIDINSAKSVSLEDCTISGFPGDGIEVKPNANLDVQLRDVTVNNSGASALQILPTGSGNLTVLVTDSSFNSNNAGGVDLVANGWTGTVTATFNLTAASNLGAGMVVASSAGQAQPVVMVTGSKLVNNGTDGLLAGNNVQVFVDRTQITGNSGNGWEAQGSAVAKSYKNNEVNGNGSDAFNGVTQITSE